MGPQGLLEYLFGLQVPAISKIDICFCYRVNIVGCIKLARRVNHRRAGRGTVVAVHPLPATGTKKRVWLQAALKKRTVYFSNFLALSRLVNTQPCQQCKQRTCGKQHHRIRQQLLQQTRLGGRRRSRNSLGRGCRYRGSDWSGCRCRGLHYYRCSCRCRCWRGHHSGCWYRHCQRRGCRGSCSGYCSSGGGRSAQAAQVLDIF